MPEEFPGWPVLSHGQQRRRGTLPLTLGTGIFLSAALLGTIWLYLATRDRWRWVTIVRWFGGGALALTLLTGGAIWFVNADHVPLLKPRAVLHELGGLHLGMLKRDVEFLLGEPADQGIWGSEYQVIDGAVHVAYDDQSRVTRVGVVTDEWALGIRRGDALWKVTDRLGAPARVFQHRSEVTGRIYAFDSLNAAFLIDSREVALLILQEDAEGFPGFEQLPPP